MPQTKDEYRKRTLAKAKEMLSKGEDNLTIYETTGWQFGHDGKWRTGENVLDRTVPSNPQILAERIKDICQQARHSLGNVKRHTVALVNNRLINDLPQLNLTEDYVHVMESTAVEHNNKHHGDEKTENKRGQTVIKDSDYELAPDILKNYNRVSVSPNKSKGGLDVVIYEKKYNDGTIYYLEEVRNGKKVLSFHNMYKKIDGSSGELMQSDKASLSLTSKTTPERDIYSADKGTANSATVQGNAQENVQSLAQKGESVKKSLTPAQDNQVHSDNFKKWFGDWENDPENASKVVDEEGKPLEVIHSTDEKFFIFDEDKLGFNTDDNASSIEAASTSHLGFWAANTEEPWNSNHMKIYLDIKNPIVFNSLDELNDCISTYIVEKGLEESSAKEIADGFKKEYITHYGYDGIIIEHDHEHDNQRSYVAFKPTQIKSATDNNGDFDGSNPDIRYSLPIGGRMRQRKNETPQDFITRQQNYVNLVVSSPEEARQRVTDEIRSMLDDKRMGSLSKQTLNQMIKEVRDADEDNLQEVIKQVHRTMNTLSDKSLNRQIDKLTNMKIQGRNGRNMSVAKNVDDATRKAFEFLKGRLIEFKATDFDDEKHTLNSELFAVRQENRNLEMAHSMATAAAEQQALEKQIDDNNQRIEDIKAKLKDLDTEIQNARSANHPIQQQTVIDLITDLSKKYNEHLLNGGEWTDDDVARQTALFVLNKRLRLDDLTSEMEKQKIDMDLKRIQLSEAIKRGRGYHRHLTRRQALCRLVR